MTKMIRNLVRRAARNMRLASAFVFTIMSQLALGAEWYVSAANGNDNNDGTTWATAFKSIQRGIDVASGTDNVIVGDGVYEPISTSRKGSDCAISIKSVNGADKSIIDGGGVCDCAYLVNRSSSEGLYSTIEGFTLRNGHIGICGGEAIDCIISNNNSSTVYRYSDGGGAKGASLIRCVIANNTAGYHGGGSYGGSSKDCVYRANYCQDYAGASYAGTHENSIFINNRADYGGAADGGTYVNCVFENNYATKRAGATDGGTFTRCSFLGNSSGAGAGSSSYGTYDGCTFKNNVSQKGSGVCRLGTYKNCLFVNNTSKSGSGVADSATLINCTLTGNKGTTTGGASASTLINTIAWNNSGGNVLNCTNSYSCTSPLQNGDGNIALNPCFVDASNGNFALAESSLCIDAGVENLDPVSVDIIGNARVRNGVVDIGAYEFQYGTEYQASGEEIVHNTYYVDAAVQVSGNGLSWEDAFQEIQEAIDVAMPKDKIIVGRGHYRPIKTEAKVLTIESAFGAGETIIDASLQWEDGITNRCASLDIEGARTNSHDHVVNDPSCNTNTTLRGFTLLNGIAPYAGGVFAGLVENCIISNCVATGNGGGAYVSRMNDCKIVFNRAKNGAGTFLCLLNRCRVQGNHANENGGGGMFGRFCNTIVVGNLANGAGGGVDMTDPINCTIVGNMAASGGGGHEIMQCENSIVWGNTLLDGETIENYNPDDYGFWGMNCCTWPEPEGYNNISADPLITWIEDGIYMLDSRSPCIDKGDNYVIEEGYYGLGDTDYAGNARVQGKGVDIGAVEMPVGTSVEINVEVDGCGDITGAGRYEIGDMAKIQAVENDGIHSFVGFFVNGVEITTDVTHHGMRHVLEYKVNGAATIIAKFRETTFYVSQIGNDANVGTTEETARRTIQSAVDSAGDGDTIIVDDGIYDPFTVQKKGATLVMTSVNGCYSTIIDGQGTSKCVYAGCENLVLKGFTIQNGNSGNGYSVGGISGSFECWDSIIKNCNGSNYAGGASSGTLYNCRIEGNTGHCYGGGCDDCILYNCIVANNRVLSGGGYIYQIGGGMYGGRAYNCTIVGNSAAQKGGGVYHTDLVNCIVLGNTAPIGPEVENRPYESGWYYATNCFSSVVLHGRGNIVGDDARFANASVGNYTLLPDSPCVDTGINGYVYTQTDFNGDKRISNEIVDIGAIEFQQPEKIDDSFAGIWGEWSIEDEISYAIPEQVFSWNELAVVAWRARDAYTRNGGLIEIPPSRDSMILSLGAIAIPDSLMTGDVEYETELENGVDVWRLRILEDTNTCSLVASIGSQAFKLSNVPSYVATLWTSAVYGKPPEYLNDAETEEWHAMRSRNRIAWLVTLVPNSRWSEYCSNRDALADTAEAAGESPLVINGIKSDANTGIHGISVRSLAEGEIRILGNDSLSQTNWCYKGFSLQPRGTAMTGAYSDKGTQFMKAILSDMLVDSDCDGISDTMETSVYGTNPHSADTSGDGISDWEKIYHYGLNPKTKDTDMDGMTDDEEILANTNPTVSANEAAQQSLNVTIRYYYDDDDRLIGTYFGREKGKTRTTLSPVGNPARIEKKGE